jgi:hypothetical protein
VGRRDHPRAGVGELFEHRLGERRALARVGADADLVEGDEGAGAGAPHDLREVRDVGREGRQVLAQVLLVADVGEHRVEGVEARTGRGGVDRRGPSARPGPRT